MVPVPRRLFQFQRQHGAPTIDDVKRELGLSDDDIDHTFGVVEIDPRDGTYAINVSSAAAETLEHNATSEGAGDARVEGPFSDPTIESMGPPTGAPTRDVSADS